LTGRTDLQAHHRSPRPPSPSPLMVVFLAGRGTPRRPGRTMDRKAPSASSQTCCEDEAEKAFTHPRRHHKHQWAPRRSVVSGRDSAPATRRPSKFLGQNSGLEPAVTQDEEQAERTFPGRQLLALVHVLTRSTKKTPNGFFDRLGRIRGSPLTTQLPRDRGDAPNHPLCGPFPAERSGQEQGEDAMSSESDGP